MKSDHESAQSRFLLHETRTVQHSSTQWSNWSEILTWTFHNKNLQYIVKVQAFPKAVRLWRVSSKSEGGCAVRCCMYLPICCQLPFLNQFSSVCHSCFILSYLNFRSEAFPFSFIPAFCCWTHLFCNILIFPTLQSPLPHWKYPLTPAKTLR